MHLTLTLTLTLTRTLTLTLALSLALALALTPAPAPALALALTLAPTVALTQVLANLKMIVVDEAHAYHGVFGSHVAQVLRRLLRLRYGMCMVCVWFVYGMCMVCVW